MNNSSLHIPNSKLVRFHVTRSRIIMALGMLAADLLSMTASILLAWGLRTLLFGRIPIVEHMNVFIFFYGFFILINFAQGLYEPVGKPREEIVKRMVIDVFFLGTGTAFIFFALKIGSTKSRSLYALIWLIQVFMSIFVRIIVKRMMEKTGLWGLPVAVLTEKEGQFSKAAAYLKEAPATGLDPVVGTYLSDPNLGQFKQQLLDNRFTTLIVFDQPIEVMETIREEFRGFVPEIVGLGHKGERSEWHGVQFCQYGGYYGLMMDQTLLRRRGQVLKRMLDLLLCSFGLILISPLFLLFMLLVKVSSPGPVFFIQKRRGKNGKTFGMLKFRTMVNDAEEKLQSILDSDPSLKAEWAEFQKLSKDPRVTPVGRFLRNTSLDELPQLLNILKGEMSLVGPRPFIIGNQLSLYGDKAHYYDMVRPGLTGLWQVSGRNRTSYQERAALDYQYIMTWSVWKDICILFATVPAVVRGRTS